MDLCGDVGSAGYLCDLAAEHATSPAAEDRFHGATVGTSRLLW